MTNDNCSSNIAHALVPIAHDRKHSAVAIICTKFYPIANLQENTNIKIDCSYIMYYCMDRY